MRRGRASRLDVSRTTEADALLAWRGADALGILADGARMRAAVLHSVPSVPTIRPDDSTIGTSRFNRTG